VARAIKKTVKIELKVKKENGQQVIDHDFESDDLRHKFFKMDGMRFTAKVLPAEVNAKDNKKKRDAGNPLGVGDRIIADDFVEAHGHGHDEIHPEIHLRFKENPDFGNEGVDEIVWFTKEENVNFVIEVGLNAALIRLRAPLPPKAAGGSITMDDVLSVNNQDNSPFDAGRFPAICAKDVEVHSGPLRDTEEVRLQRFYKWHARVLGTDIVLDPHIEGHDD